MKITKHQESTSKSTRINLRVRKPLYGLGIHDVTEVGYYKSYIYDKWKNMMSRCYSPGMHKSEKHRRLYAGCTVDPRWHRLSNFKEWMESHPDYETLTLDKDLISPGNKVYGPDTCCMITSRMNTLLVHGKCKSSKTNDLPNGVSYSCKRVIHPYEAYASIPPSISHRKNYKIHIGNYPTVKEAYRAHLEYKRDLLLECQDDVPNVTVKEHFLRHIDENYTKVLNDPHFGYGLD
tara:strand:+ start:710 stop:1411 length:702 start_codon:yes stop_codon:yes gene_type:complete